MKWLTILTTLLCFIFTGILAAYGAEEKDQKGEYQKQAETKLKELNQKLEELKIKATELTGKAKKEFHDQLEKFKKTQEAANKKLEELKSASGKTWGKMKAEMDRTLEELDRQYNKMVSRFKKK